MLNKSLKELNRERFMVQAGLAAESLLKVEQKRSRISHFPVLGKLVDRLQLDDEAGEVQAIHVRADRVILQVQV